MHGRIACVAIVVVCVGLAVGSRGDAQEPDYPRLANYYLHGFVDEERIADLAQWDLLILKTVWTEEQLALLRSLNPDIKIYLYLCVYCLESPALPNDAFAASLHRYAEDFDLWWYDADGQVASDWPGSKMINVVSPLARGPIGDWLQFLTASSLRLIIERPSVDGLFFDNFWRHISWNQDALRLDSDCHPVFNPAGCDGIPDSKTSLDFRWNNTMREFITTMRQHLDRLGRNRDRPLTLLTNSSSDYFESLNGTLYEFFPGGSKPDYGGVHNYAWRVSMFRSPGGYMVAPFRKQPYSVSVINASWRGNTQAPLRSEDFERHKRFTLGSTLLGDGYYSLDTGTQGHGNLWWEPEFDHAGVGKGYLGQALGPARSIAPIGTTNFLRNGSFAQGLEHWHTGFVHVDASTHVTPASVLQLGLNELYHPTGHARLTQTSVRLTQNKAHTLRFTAHGMRPMALEVTLTSDDCPQHHCVPNWRFDLGTEPREYALSFIAPATTAANLNFILREPGLLRLREVSLRNGSQDIYRRDFENGSVVVNYTTQLQLIDHGAPLTRLSIPGSGFFDGRTVSVDYVASGDAVLYVNPSGASHGATKVRAPGTRPSDEAPPSPQVVVESATGGASIRFDLAHPDRIGMQIFDVRGRRVRDLRPASPAAAGRHHTRWDGTDDRGLPLAPGVYFLRFTAADTAIHRKLLLAR